MLARIVNGVVAEYPYSAAQLRAAFPQTSFPADLCGCDLAAFGAVHVVAVPHPALQPGEAADEGTPALVSGEWRQTWTVRAETPEELAAAKATASAEIDADAEAARLRFITPGAGQSLEYAATEAEARAFVAAGGTGEPEAYPWLNAERLAAGGTATVAQVAQQVLALADAWRASGAEIKRIRRAAKLQVEAATTIAAVRAALAGTDWPQP
jgi:hypothetical protein